MFYNETCHMLNSSYVFGGLCLSQKKSFAFAGKNTKQISASRHSTLDLASVRGVGK